MKKLLSVGVLMALALASCKKEGCTDPDANNYNWDAEKDNGWCEFDANLVVEVNPKFNGEMISFDSVYHNIMGYRVQFTSIRFYTTYAKVGNGGVWTDANSVAQFNYTLSNILFSDQVVPGNYSEIAFDVGVDSVRNHSDPSTYATSHPLSTISSSGMFWTWNTGYRFIVIEGVYDTDSLGTGVPPNAFSYHIGLDPYLKTNAQSVSLNLVESMTTTLTYEMNLDKFFYNATDTLDMDVNPTIHMNSGQETIGDMLANNFNDNLVLE